jgi:hypothetical protein
VSLERDRERRVVQREREKWGGKREQRGGGEREKEIE